MPTFQFTTPEAVHRAFQSSATFALITLFACFIATLFYVNQGPTFARPRFITLVVSFCVIAASTSAFLWMDCYSNFIEARMEGNRIVLTYASPMNGAGRTMSIAPADVREVLFGLPGKGNYGACYIRLELHDGSRLRSADKSMATEACKALRREILDLVQR